LLHPFCATAVAHIGPRSLFNCELLAGHPNARELTTAHKKELTMVDFVTPVKKDGPPNGPTEVISGTTRLLYSSRVMYVGIAGDGNNIVKTVSPDVPNAVTIEDAGVTGGIRWFRLSRAHGDKFKLQAKDAKGVVVASCELSVIELPQASGPLEFGFGPADPKSPNKIDFHAYLPKDDPDYIDARMTYVSYNIYQFGFLVDCSGMSTPIHVSESMVDLNPTKYEPIDAKVYDTLAQANEAIRRAPAKPKGVTPFAYYRGAGGAVISPTIFSPATTPRIIATFLEARRLYADFVQKALAGLAISLAGGVILRVALGPFLRAFPADPKPPRAVPPPIPRRISPAEITEETVRAAMKGAPLKSQQSSVSLPTIRKYVQMLQEGKVPPAIKVDQGMIVEGNHRYIAGRIFGKDPPIQPWAGGRPAWAVPWDKIKVDTAEW
jgi:hypothetical protein